MTENNFIKRKQEKLGVVQWVRKSKSLEKQISNF